MNFPKNAPPLLKPLCMLLQLAGPEAAIEWMKQFPEEPMTDEGPIKVGTVVRVPMTSDEVEPARVTVLGWLSPSRWYPYTPRFRGQVEGQDEVNVFTLDDIEEGDAALVGVSW